MPWTLYRYILKDLVRLLLLSTGVLVVAIAFAAAIKPLSDGLLGPSGLFKFVLYSLPTMLAFALPFAAAFSSTLVFTRMAADNEVLACRASGLSYLSLLVPVVFLGLILTLVLFYLSNWVIPEFYRLAEQQLQKDVTRVLVTQVQKHQPFRRGNLVLYADDASETPLESGRDRRDAPQRLIILRGVAVAVLDEQEQPKTEATARQADVYLYRDRGQSYASLELSDVSYYDNKVSSQLTRPEASTHRMTISGIRLPSPFTDRLQFFSLADLLNLGVEPERFDKVAQAKAKLAEAVAAEDLLRKMAAAVVAPPGGGGLFMAREVDERYTIRAPRVERGGGELRLLGTPADPVVVEHAAGSGAPHRLTAQAANLSVEADEGGTEPLVRVELEGVQVFDPRVPGKPIEQKRRALPRLYWTEPLLATAMERSSLALVAESHRPEYERSRRVQVASRALQREHSRLAQKVEARLHERAASAGGCVLLLALGAVLSLALRGRQPLVVYFWAFLLATLALVIARSGENIASDAARSTLALGLGVVWSGNLLVLAVVLLIYWRLSRT